MKPDKKKKETIGQKIAKFLVKNPVSSRFRQVFCRWRKVKRHGVTIWYQPVKRLPGYSEYDHEIMFEKAVRVSRKFKREYRDRRVAIPVEVYYSGGRPGIGTRMVSYKIMPYRKVF